MDQRIARVVFEEIDRRAQLIEDELKLDVLSYTGQINSPSDKAIRDAIQRRPQRRSGVAVVLTTPGGSLETTERMVTTLRHHYPDHVEFIVPDFAYSAGTLLASSGNEIWMSHISSLGPVDPQTWDPRLNRYVSVDAFLLQYKRLVDESKQKEGLNPIDANLATQISMLELENFQQAKKLATEYVQTWLCRYKFKDWSVTDSTNTVVTPERRENQAREIANRLADSNRWHSHSRGISADTLENEVGLKIKRLEDNPKLEKLVAEYYDLLDGFKLYTGVDPLVHCFGMLTNQERSKE